MGQPIVSVGVCSWSLQVGSIPELVGFLETLGTSVVQIACGDPHHASWVEGDRMPEVAKAAPLQLQGAMIGFPGEDYTTPETIRLTGGFGPGVDHAARLDRLAWAVARTRALGLNDLMMHAGFIPDPGDPERSAFLEVLRRAAAIAAREQVTLALETGQETADLLRLTLDELQTPNLRVNFDPANMLLYDKGDPIRAVQILAPYLRSVHVKDAIPPKTPGEWGEEVPLGQGRVDIPRFLHTLRATGYSGPLFVEREVGNQTQRVVDIAHGLNLIRNTLSQTHSPNP